MLRSLIATVFLVAVCTSGAASGATLSIADKANLQAAMYRAIDRASVNGAFLHFSVQKQRVENLYPAKAHTMIMRMGQHYILCTDFRNINGKTVNVDFYVAKSKKTFVVFHTAVQKRKVVKDMVRTGIATSVR